VVGLLGVSLVIQPVGLLAPLLLLLQVHQCMAAAAGGGKTFSAKYEYSACCKLFLVFVGDCFICNTESVIQCDKGNRQGGRDTTA
jgi:hypothetical protein